MKVGSLCQLVYLQLLMAWTHSSDSDFAIENCGWRHSSDSDALLPPMDDKNVDSDSSAPIPQPPKTRGRPKGSFQLITKYPRRSNKDDTINTAASPTPDPIIENLRALGTDFQKHVCEQLQNTTRDEEDKAPIDAKFVAHCLGQKPRPVIPRVVEAAILGYKNSSFCVKQIMMLAACTFNATRMHWSILVSRLAADIATKTILPVAMFVYFLSDNTDANMSMKVDEDKSSLQCGNTKQTELCKVLQSELMVGFLVSFQGALEFIYCDVPSGLKVGDRSTAEVLRVQIERVLNLPLLRKMRAMFPTFVNMTSGDLGSNNTRCENSYIRDFPTEWRLFLFCLAHRYSTVQGYSFQIFKSTVSGLISFTMAQKPSGAFKHLSNAIKSSILALVEVFVGLEPPGPDSAEWESQQLLLDFIEKLSTRPFRKKQRLLLEHLFRGHARSPRIAFFLPAGLSSGDASRITERWAKDASRALLPYATSLFARHRWCLSSDSFAGVGLIALQNGILAEAAPRWMEAMGHKPSDKSCWEDGDGLDLVLAVDPAGVKSEEYWKEFNERNRIDGFLFAVDPETPIRLILLMCTMEPLIKSFQLVLYLGSVRYEQ
jgi:hypothetical protein